MELLDNNSLVKIMCYLSYYDICNLRQGSPAIDEKFDNPKFNELFTYYRYGISSFSGLNFHVVELKLQHKKQSELMEVHKGFINYAIFDERCRLVSMEPKRVVSSELDVHNKHSVLNHLLFDQNPNIARIVYYAPIHILLDLCDYLLQFKFSAEQRYLFTKLSTRLCSHLVVHRMFHRMTNILFSLSGSTYHDFLSELRRVILNFPEHMEAWIPYCLEICPSIFDFLPFKDILSKLEMFDLINLLESQGYWH